MALLEIPVSNTSPAFSFFIDLEGVTYQLVFRYNGRMENWIFDIFDDDQEPIQTGNTFISGFPMLRQNRNENKYPGTLLALNTTLQGLNADRFTIGVDVKFLYNESESE